MLIVESLDGRSRLPRLVALEHGVDGGEELSHDGGPCNFAVLAGSAEAFVDVIGGSGRDVQR